MTVDQLLNQSTARQRGYWTLAGLDQDLADAGIRNTTGRDIAADFMDLLRALDNRPVGEGGS